MAAERWQMFGPTDPDSAPIWFDRNAGNANSESTSRFSNLPVLPAYAVKRDDMRQHPKIRTLRTTGFPGR
jgi:hypothetical protein